jgi:hypothetical protein
MSPLLSITAILLPSPEKANPYQAREPAAVCFAHVTPLSLDT